MSTQRLLPQCFENDTGILRVWNLPFVVVREFEIRGVPQGARRGGHAHRTCDQIIRCSNGEFLLTTETHNRDDGWLMRVGDAVLVPRMHWIVLSDFSLDAVVTVLCSELYVPPITDWDEFVREAGK